MPPLRPDGRALLGPVRGVTFQQVCQRCSVARRLQPSQSSLGRSRTIHNVSPRLPSQPCPPPPRLLRRPYHSYDHPPPAGAFNATESTILAAAYAHVPEHGFSRRALALGARDAGFLDVSANLLPDEAFSLVRWHLVTQRQALADRARELFDDKDDAQQHGVGEKVERLTWERLLGNQPLLARWQEALAIMAQPSYVPASLKELAQLADEIYFLAGDVSVDPSWYTKRASLSAIYAATELYMTSDTSLEFRDTRDFLRRRFDETNEIGGYMRSLGQWVGFTASAGVNVLRSKGLRI